MRTTHDDSAQSSPTLPPGPADADAAAFELAIRVLGEYRARLELVAARMGLDVGDKRTTKQP